MSKMISYQSGRDQSERDVQEQTYWVNQVKQNPEEFEYYLKHKVMKEGLNQVHFY